MARSPKAVPAPLGPEFPITSPPEIMADVTARQNLMAKQDANIQELQLQLESINIVTPFDLQVYFGFFTQALHEHALTAWKLCALAHAIVVQSDEREWRPLMEQAGYSAGYVRQLSRVFRVFDSKPAFHNMQVSKLLELSRLPDTELARVETEGTDRYDRMSMRELREAVRESKKEKAAQDQKITNLRNRVLAAEERNDLIKVSDMARFNNAIDQLGKHINGAMKELAKVEAALLEWDALEREGAPQALRDQAASYRQLLRERLIAVGEG